MKHLITIILSIALLFALTGCESDNDVEVSANNSSSEDIVIIDPEESSDNDPAANETVGTDSDSNILGEVWNGLTETNSDRLEQLTGRWNSSISMPDSTLDALFGALELYEEEIALCSDLSMDMPYYMEFTADKTYTQAWDIEGLKENFEVFYREMFNVFYEGRATMSNAYGEDFASMDKDEFLLYMAQVFGYESYEEAIDGFVNDLYDYDVFLEPLMSGSFSIDGHKIMISDSQYIGFEIDDSGDLTLSFDDGEEYYTRAE